MLDMDSIRTLLCVLLSPFQFRHSILALQSSASRFVFDLTTELAATFLTPAVYAFDIALETARSIKLQGFGHHLRRRADLSPAYFDFVVYLFSFSSPSCIEYLFVSTSSLRIKSPAPGIVGGQATETRPPLFFCVLSLSPDR